MAALVLVTILLEVSVAAVATSHVVGGSTRWTVPPNSTFYSDWASSQTVVPCDTLVFNFPTGVHDVVKVPKSSYDSCTSTNQIGSTLNTGPSTITVASGTHYYICAVPGHCSAGQKLAITVAAAAATPSASSPAPTANDPAPTADRKAAASPGSVALTDPASARYLNPPRVPGPAGSGNGYNSSPGLRTEATVVVLLAVATASFLF